MNRKYIYLTSIIAILSLTSCGGSNTQPKPINYNSVEEFEITETSAAELSQKMMNIRDASYNALDNFGVSLKGKSLSFDYVQNTTHIVQYSEDEGDGTVESTMTIGVKDFDFTLDSGWKGLKSAKEAPDLTGYVELKDTKGTISYNAVDEHNIENKATYSLVDNNFEFYHTNEKEYVHFSKDLINTVFGLLSKMVPEENRATISLIRAAIPDSGKYCFYGIADSVEYPLIKESNGDTSENNDDFTSFASSLLELKRMANDNGYLVSQLMGIKVTSDKSHYLGIELSINSEQLNNLKELRESSEEEMELPFGIDDNTNFDNFLLSIEADKEMRINYSKVEVDNLSTISESSMTYSTTREGIEKGKIHLEANMDYSVNVSSHIPNKKELETYETNSYDVKQLLGLLLK